jgi:hypothetical protein
MSNILRISVTVVALLLVIAVLRGQPAQQTQQQVALGRYQIVQGEYVAVGTQVGVPMKGVFRIDTQTGTSWTFIEGASTDGKHVQRWVPISEPDASK